MKAPFFDWVAVGQGPTDAATPPKGLIVITTSYVRTPPVAAAVRSMRTHGHGATYEPTSPVAVAGFKGTQFDGVVTGREEGVHPVHRTFPYCEVLRGCELPRQGRGVPSDRLERTTQDRGSFY